MIAGALVLDLRNRIVTITSDCEIAFISLLALMIMSWLHRVERMEDLNPTETSEWLQSECPTGMSNLTLFVSFFYYCAKV